MLVYSLIVRTCDRLSRFPPGHADGCMSPGASESEALFLLTDFAPRINSGFAFVFACLYWPRPANLGFA
jgi:hypothetical protein